MRVCERQQRPCARSVQSHVKREQTFQFFSHHHHLRRHRCFHNSIFTPSPFLPSPLPPLRPHLPQTSHSFIALAHLSLRCFIHPPLAINRYSSTSCQQESSIYHPIASPSLDGGTPTTACRRVGMHGFLCATAAPRIERWWVTSLG